MLVLKVADYPFTTLFPNLGVIYNKDYRDIIFADIPGIIKNAYNGAGLGLKFLGILKSVVIFLHFIDISKRDIIKQYEVMK